MENNIARRIWHFFNAYRRFFRQIRNYQKYIKKSKRAIKNSEKVRVVFLINFPESWNSVKSIYEEACKRDKLEV